MGTHAATPEAADAFTFTVDSGLPEEWQANILTSVHQIDELMEPDWTRLDVGPAAVAFVPWAGFMTLPGASALAGADAGALVYPTAAYVSAQAEVWKALWLHEFGGHVVAGLPDRPFTAGSASLMGYQDPEPTGLTYDVVEAIQDRYRPDSGDNVITITGTTPGRVFEGAGNGTVNGSDHAADMIYGNQGNDRLYGNGGADILYGGQDADLLDGGAGDDAAYGNLGNDTLSAGAGNDSLFGGQGDDLLIGIDGANLLVGGLGNDTYRAGGDDTVVGFQDGIDTLELIGSVPPTFADV